MADNPLKKLRDELKAGPPPEREAKANHTLYLSEPQFSVFRNYCKFVGRRPSEIVDRLIASFLEEIRDDLPPDPEKPK